MLFFNTKTYIVSVKHPEGGKLISRLQADNSPKRVYRHEYMMQDFIIDKNINLKPETFKFDIYQIFRRKIKQNNLLVSSDIYLFLHFNIKHMK